MKHLNYGAKVLLVLQLAVLITGAVVIFGAPIHSDSFRSAGFFMLFLPSAFYSLLIL